MLRLDAIEAGRAPGDLIVAGPEELPRLLQHTLSSHQARAEVLALTGLRGTIRERLAAVGMQPKRIEMSTRVIRAAPAPVGAGRRSRLDSIDPLHSGENGAHR